MKNIFAYILGFLTVSMLFAGTNVWALDALSGSCSLVDQSATGPNLALQLSPGVTINYNALSNEFEICGLNGNGNVEYGTASSVQGIYMHAATTITAIGTTDGSTIDDWTLMGDTSS